MAAQIDMAKNEKFAGQFMGIFNALPIAIPVMKHVDMKRD